MWAEARGTHLYFCLWVFRCLAQMLAVCTQEFQGEEDRVKGLCNVSGVTYDHCEASIRRLFDYLSTRAVRLLQQHVDSKLEKEEEDTEKPVAAPIETKQKEQKVNSDQQDAPPAASRPQYKLTDEEVEQLMAKRLKSPYQKAAMDVRVLGFFFMCARFLTYFVLLSGSCALSNPFGVCMCWWAFAVRCDHCWQCWRRAGWKR